MFVTSQSNRRALYRHVLLLAFGGMLAGCQTPSMSTDQRMQLALGVAQSERVDVAETSLLTMQAEYQRDHNRLGEARAAFALGELYKSKRWQDQQQPPETINSYVRAADFYQQAATLYQQLEQPALEASAHVGAANAFLLADQLPKACQNFEEAQRLASDPRMAQDRKNAEVLERSLQFFSDLTVVCAIRPR